MRVAEGETVTLPVTAERNGAADSHPSEPLSATVRRRPDNRFVVEVASGQLRSTLTAGEALTTGAMIIACRHLSEKEVATVLSKSKSAGSHSHLSERMIDDRYQLGAEVGRGGTGRVFEAAEKRLERKVAIKFLLQSQSKEDQERFIREARITGRLQHPSIVPVHELGLDENGRAFYTMKLARGVTLLQILRDLTTCDPIATQTYSLPLLLTIFQKICDAVAFAHSQSPPVIHRDLKPGNIMVGDYGEVLVMDWGAAKLMDATDKVGSGTEPSSYDANASAESLLTQPGTIMGTPGYMAPEQAAGRAAAADQRTDVYALGAILYSLLTLEVPPRVSEKEIAAFEKREQDVVNESWRARVAPMLADRSTRPRLPHLPNKSIPDSLAAVALQAMSFHPKDRFQSVKELQADVSAYQAGFATKAEKAHPWKRFQLFVRRNQMPVAALSAIFVILLSATVISLYQRHATLKSNRALQLTLQHASMADFEAARERFDRGAWREGIALLGRALTFWSRNRQAANYLLSAIAFGRGDREKLPIFGVHHDGAIIHIAFSRDGRYFATASYDHTVRVWDTVSGVQVGKTIHHSGACVAVAFSPDGRRLLTGDEDGVARLWDTSTWNPVTPPMRHGRPDLDRRATIGRAIFSPDGKTILTASFDHTARLWDAKTGKELAQLVNPQRVADAVFSPDQTRILTSYWYGGAILWDATTLQPIGAPMKNSATNRKSRFTPDGNVIVTSSMDRTARIWDGHTAKPLSPPLMHDDFVWDFDISPDGKLLATASYDKKIRLWSIPGRKPVGVPMKHNGPVDTVAFSPDGSRLVSSSRDKTVRVWDVATCQPVGNPMRHDETVLTAAFNPRDSSRVLSAGWDSAAYLWDAKPPASPGEVIPISDKVSEVEFTSDDDLLFVATEKGKAGIWSLSRKAFATPTIQQANGITLAAFDARHNQCATADNSGVIRFYGTATGKLVGQTAAIPDSIKALDFVPDGHSLFAAYLGGSVLQWKIPDGTQIGQPLKHSEKMDALAVAPNGEQLATGCRDDYLYLWNTADSKLPPRKLRHTNPVLAVAYSPDGKFIATGGDDHTARIWSLASGKEIGSSFYIDSRVTALRYTDNGSKLLAGGADDNEVHCYDTRTHGEVYLPLPHPTGVSHITANADGSQIITVDNDGVARLWRIPSTSDPPPRWLPDYLRCIGGLVFSEHQQLVQVTTRDRLALRKKLLAQPPENTAWDKLMRQSFTRDR